MKCVQFNDAAGSAEDIKVFVSLYEGKTVDFHFRHRVSHSVIIFNGAK